MMKPSIILNAIATKSGMVVTPIWHRGSSGRICFRDMAFVMNSSLPSKMYTNTGKHAETIEQAYEMAKEWAEEN